MAKKNKSTKAKQKELIKSEQKKAPKRLHRSTKDKLVAGVCGGIAEYLEMDPVIIRFGWIVLTIISFGAGIVLYLLAWIVFPKK